MMVKFHKPLYKAGYFLGETWHWGVGPLDSHDDNDKNHDSTWGMKTS